MKKQLDLYWLSGFILNAVPGTLFVSKGLMAEVSLPLESYL